MEESESELGLDEIGQLLREQLPKYDISHLLTRFDPGPLDGTETTLECRYVAIGANGRPLLRELIQVVCHHVLDYTIPPSLKQKAVEEVTQRNSSAGFSKLEAQARSLFVDLLNTGEGGELLVFVLAESYLGLKQAIPKMHLKTDTNLHFNGADGVFVGAEGDQLEVYWGESKLHASLHSAIPECLNSIEPFFLHDPEVDRDFELFHYMDLDNSSLENAIKSYMDPDSSNYLKRKDCAVCLVGFNMPEIATGQEPLTPETVADHLQSNLQGWKSYITAKIVERSLHLEKMYLFFLPLNSVSEFRRQFLGVLGLREEDE